MSNGAAQPRAPLATLDQHKPQEHQQQQQQLLHASINTTRSAVDSSNGSYASAASSSLLDSSLECGESLDHLSESEVTGMAANYPELAARALALASQSALDRVHIQSLEAQVEAARIWSESLVAEANRARTERDQWRSQYETQEGALRQTQILLACMREAHDPAVPATPADPSLSPRSAAFESERRLLSSHHRAALDAKDALISTLVADRDASESALRQLRADYATLLQTAAATRYTDAVLAQEHRDKLQRLVEQQLNQQRRDTEAAVTAALATAANTTTDSTMQR